MDPDSMNFDPRNQSNMNDLQKVEEEGLEEAKSVLLKLYRVWNELGLENEQMVQRSTSVWSHIYNLLHDILEEETAYCDTIKENIQKYEKKIVELSSVMELTPQVIQGSLILKEELMKKEIETLTKLKCMRIKSFTDLKNIESKYCQILRFDEISILPQGGVPSEKDIAELQQQVAMLQKEKEKRYERFCTLKSDIAAIYEQIDLEPETNIEKEIMYNRENLSLSNETFKILDDMKLRATQVKAELETQWKDLVEKLTVLWTRLNIPDNQKGEFLANHKDCKVTTIKQMQKELKRCEELKKANLAQFIDNLKVELEALWSKAYISDSQKPELSTEITDQALEEYEAEVEKWKSYYQSVCHILEKIEKRQKLFNLLLTFDQKAMDPNRFKNRKGNLLKEERERNKLQKDLPSLETEIFQYIQEYESEHGIPFLYLGEDFRSVVTRQWADRINHKEAVKLERHKQHLLNLKNGSTPPKRPIVTTPRTAPSKLQKLSAGTSQFRTPAPQERVKRIPSTMGRFTSKCRQLLSSQKKGLQRQVLKDANQNALMQASHDLTSYSSFANELNSPNRYKLRSSVLATRKPGGTRISKSRKSIKACRKSISVSNQSPRFTPTRGKYDLPIII